ncbi:MAG: DUF262 domain-containing protein [Akkermansiaceae bacterium]|nr:DUF262 domain-containing protein [Akkermansiaceae bacterium]
MSKLENKITADDRTISQVLAQKKYTVDYFQREYSWEKKHMEQLVEDLANAFLACYDPGHDREETENYNSYYLGPFVLSEKEGQRSIIDGQQRLTSLTLFLIFLYHRLKDPDEKTELCAMIYSTKRGKKSFNLTVEKKYARHTKKDRRDLFGSLGCSHDSQGPAEQSFQPQERVDSSRACGDENGEVSWADSSTKGLCEPTADQA